MAIRDELFAKFGPLLLEAIADFLLDNINTLRKEQGKPEISKDAYLILLSNHITELEPYDWMSESEEPEP